MTYISLLNSYTFWGNSLFAYVLALGVAIGIMLVAKVFEKIILVKLKTLSKKTKNTVDDVVVDAIHEMGNMFYVVIGLYIGSRWIVMNAAIARIVHIVFVVVVTYEVIRAVQILVRFALEQYASKSENPASRESMVHLGMLFARIGLWSIALLFVLSNLGVDITALVASLGIGSLAIALALQNILSDMFSSFSIYADKPFEIGDYIVIGTDSGTVKKIGLKTTRITSLQGEELVVSNKELTTVRVQNYKKMKRRRVAFTFGVTYGTSKKHLEEIPKMVADIVSSIEHLEFDRCHFHEFGNSALQFDVVYYVDTREYDVYIDTRQAFNLALFSEFDAQHIEFAYPTQTIFVKK